jgi:hypothetical protein
MQQLLINWLKVRVLPGPPSFYEGLGAIGLFKKKVPIHVAPANFWLSTLDHRLSTQEFAPFNSAHPL